MKIINRFGEVYYDKNEGLVTMPFNRLNSEEVEILEENYRNKVKEIEHPDTFIYATQFNTIRDRLQITYDLNGCVDFHQLHKVKLRDMLPFLYSMVEMAKVDVNILWQRNNMVVDLTEKRVKALLFEFEGFKLYKNDDAVDGLKEIILLALTKNTSILAKPKKADYIEQTNEVFQFSDDIIASKTIEEVEAVIKAYERELEYQEIKAEKEKEEKKQKSFLFAFKEKLNKKKPKKKPDEELKEKLHDEVENKNENKKPTQSLMDKLTTPIGMVVTLAVLLISGFLITNITSSDASTEISEAEKTIEQQEEVLEAYRLYITGDEEQQEEAFAKLDAIGHENLSDEDQNTLINWYIEQNQYTKALTLDPSSAYKISDKIIAESEGDTEKAKADLQMLESSFSNIKVLSFDIANLEGNYQSMIENSQLEKYNDKRSKEVVKAYVLTNQLEELESLIDNYKNDENLEKSYENLQDHTDKYADQYVNQKNISDELETLKEDLENKKKEKDKEKDEDKEESLKDDIKDIEHDIEQKNKELKNIEESIRK